MEFLKCRDALWKRPEKRNKANVVATTPNTPTHVVRFRATAGCNRCTCAVSHFLGILLPAAVSASAVTICLNEHNHIFAHAQEFDFSWGGSRIQRCENWYRAFTNPFASSSINFGFALKLLRIKDQWDTVLVKCQFVCKRDLSVF